MVYTRWGSTTCSNTSGAELLYAGRAAGSWWNEVGGGANYLCLPEQPENSTFTAGSQGGRAYLYGTEYQTRVGDNAEDIGPLQFSMSTMDLSTQSITTLSHVQCATLQHEKLL